jgi:hypothetical protein
MFRSFRSRRSLSKRCASPESARLLPQRGYAYLMALFMIVTTIIASQVAMKNILTEGRREREADMIWRGQQFVRAIRLYYLKTGHYPSSLDDLKKGMPELHFLRYAAYKDPMKKDDGAWRFIYVNAAGQIIGSVKYATLQQMAIMDMNGGKIPAPQNGDQSNQPGIPVSSLANQNSGTAANSSNPPQPNAPTDPNAAPNGASAPPGALPDNSASSGAGPQNPANSPQTPAPAAQATASAQTNQGPLGSSASPASPLGGAAASVGGLNASQNNVSMAALAALKPTGPVDGPVLGGFLTGVGSTVDKPSVRVYNGGKKYSDWEFIWNPVEDQAKAVQQGISNPQGTVPGQPGQAIGNGPGGTSIFGNSAAGSNPNPANPSSSNPMSPNSAAPPVSNPFQSAPAPQQ